MFLEHDMGVRGRPRGWEKRERGWGSGEIAALEGWPVPGCCSTRGPLIDILHGFILGGLEVRTEVEIVILNMERVKLVAKMTWLIARASRSPPLAIT